MRTRAVPAASIPVSLSAPTGGWNARDSLANMAANDAVYSVNLFPTTTDVIVRKGHTRHATGLPGQVETLMSYAGGTSQMMFAVSSGKIYDVSSPGAVGAPEVTGLSNSRWEYVNNATPGGAYMMAVNGVDKMQYFDGTNWHTEGSGSPYNITGVDTSDVSNINIHKFRVWLVEKGTLKAYYLATGNIGGSATAFDLSGTAMLGGYLVSMYTWTIDAGYGVDDIAVFLTSKGEVIIYRGTDPSSANTWALVGIFRIGRPIGNRPCIKYSGDLLIISEDGVYPMSGALQSSRTNPRVALTDKIQYAVSSAVSRYSENFGWQLLQFPRENMIFLNVPVQEGESQQQYVMNMINKSWCNFTGWNANCFALYGDDPYFGGDGFVGHAWNGFSDDGQNINTDGLQAFSYFDSAAILKHCTMMRPTFLTNGVPSVNMNVNVDFDLSNTTAPISFSSIPYAAWDVGEWDNALWGSDLLTSSLWQGANGVGHWLAPHIQTASTGIEVHWVSTDLVMKKGAVL